MRGGAFRETGALCFLLSRRAHLLTTCPQGRWWYPSRWSGSRARLRAKSLATLGCAPTRLAAARRPRRDAAPAGAYRQRCQSCGFGHRCLRRGKAYLPSACENLPPAALSQRQGDTKRIALLSLWRKRNRNGIGGENGWQFTIWRRRSSAEGRVARPARLRPI